MSKYLYLLCEGETDELFYERVAERLSSLSFDRPTDLRPRPGANLKTALALTRLLLNRISHWSGDQDIAVIIAVDNDRAPGHPGGTAYEAQLPSHDLRKEPRYPALKALIEEKLGSDPAGRSVDVALAVPVEMLESWALVLAGDGNDLPPFSKADSRSARTFYGNTPPPPQLKDRIGAIASERGCRKDELAFELADSGDLDALKVESPSFALFAEDVAKWQS